MNGNGKGAGTGRGGGQEAAQMRALGLSTGWNVFSYMISGLVAYGAIGWGIGRAVHAAWPFPVGMMVGLAISVGFVIYRYGRQGSLEQGRDGQGRVRGMTDDR